ncbi:MAG: TolC family protein [Elusimicrobia bacterium]|nr:TolC family protein [Elusimicrobiota bacterium]
MRILAPAALFLVVAGPVAAAGTPVRLREAVEAATGSRIESVVAGERSQQARSRALEAASELLPRLTASVSQSRTYKVNLAAQGLDFPGFAPLLGPFNTFDARLRLTQKVFDWGDWRRAQSGRAAARAAGAEEKAAREQVAAAAALSYLEALRAQRSVAASSADKDVADRLLSLARDRKEHGAVTGVDVVRAQARAADADAALLRAQVSEREALLILKRVAGWPLDRELSLADDFSVVSSTPPEVAASLSAALGGRAEIAAAEERASGAELAAKAAFGDRAPSILLTGDYARSGAQPSDSKNVGAVGAALAVPLFSGGMLKGRQEEAESRRREALASLADVRQQVELDVRLSIERLSEAAEEERATELSLSLGERELAMAQDRYGAGLGTAIEVVEAQAQLARARSAQVSALARYHSSRVNYASALGRAGEFSL